MHAFLSIGTFALPIHSFSRHPLIALSNSSSKSDVLISLTARFSSDGFEFWMAMVVKFHWKCKKWIARPRLIGKLTQGGGGVGACSAMNVPQNVEKKMESKMVWQESVGLKLTVLSHSPQKMEQWKEFCGIWCRPPGTLARVPQAPGTVPTCAKRRVKAFCWFCHPFFFEISCPVHHSLNQSFEFGVKWLWVLD